MKLNMIKRSNEKKGAVKRLRREGMIPAVLYLRGQPSETMAVSEAEFEALLRHVPKGRLATARVQLVDESGAKRTAIIKAIDYCVTSYKVIHLDFEELKADVKVKVNIPIECIGAADCSGIKLGGVLRQVIRALKVQCLPKDIPSYFEVDVKNLAVNDAIKLGALSIPAEVRPLNRLDEVCVVIAKR